MFEVQDFDMFFLLSRGNKMETKLLDGKQCASIIHEQIIKDVQNLKKMNIIPYLAVILVGSDKASQVYVNRKEKLAKRLGIATKTYYFSSDVDENIVLQLIDELNNDKSVHGILVQMPLPKHLQENKIIEAISPDKDVDGFHPLNIGKLSENEAQFLPCTPYGIMTLLEKNQCDISGKNCVVIGRSAIVGKPLATLLLQQNATVTICHSQTKNLKQYTKMADYIFVSIGQAHFLTEDMIQDDVVLIDVGINREHGKIVGDIDPSCYQKAKRYTPVPGGVGPMTLAMLMKQTIEIAQREV